VKTQFVVFICAPRTCAREDVFLVNSTDMAHAVSAAKRKYYRQRRGGTLAGCSWVATTLQFSIVA
jgi:hypothetical protein